MVKHGRPRSNGLEDFATCCKSRLLAPPLAMPDGVFAMMAALRLLLTVVGVLAIIMGVLWMAQGTGLFPYPAESFMINQTPWILRGALLAVAGLVVVWATRRFIR
jgi:hypothetical protein